jgi:hypothetical protein
MFSCCSICTEFVIIPNAPFPSQTCVMHRGQIHKVGISNRHPAWRCLQGRLRALRLSWSRCARCHKLVQLLVSILHTSYQLRPTSFCALCAINSALSCSTIICSSLYANAHGTPSSSALVLTTHNVLPPMNKPDFSHELVVDTFDWMERRVEAGIISWRARIRSYRVSSVGAEAMEDVSDSSVATISVSLLTMKPSRSGFGVVYTRVCVPVVFVMRAFLFANELFIHNFLELDHLDSIV